MCEGCYIEGGSPKILNEIVKEAVEAIKEVYQYNPVGGALHIQLDDWNIDNFSLSWPDWCIRINIEPREWYEYEAEKYCYNLMRSMTEDERASALAIAQGYWDPSSASLDTG